MSREYSVECYGHAIPNSCTVDKNITLTGCSFDESDNYEPKRAHHAYYLGDTERRRPGYVFYELL